MTYATVVPELLSRFPTIKARYHDSDWDDLPYVVFGCVLIPALEADLKLGDTDEIVSLCSFIEECTVGARQDNKLADLIKVEVGEWLQGTTNEEGIAPFLGPETRRLCRHVPGLANQRWRLKLEKQRSSLWNMITAQFRKQ